MWRSSKAFERLTVRMLGLMAFATASGMGLLILVKQNNEFGARAPARVCRDCVPCNRLMLCDRALDVPFRQCRSSSSEEDMSGRASNGDITAMTQMQLVCARTAHAGCRSRTRADARRIRDPKLLERAVLICVQDRVPFSVVARELSASYHAHHTDTRWALSTARSHLNAPRPHRHRALSCALTRAAPPIRSEITPASPPGRCRA